MIITREDYRKEMNEFSEQLKEGVSMYFNSEAYRKYLKMMGMFKNYSFQNTMLIARQNPEATLVAGFRTWQTKFKRSVKTGEKGIRIMAPTVIKREMSDGSIIRIPTFRSTYVYDISQTEGEPLPVIKAKELNEKIEDFENFRRSVISACPCRVTFRDLGEGDAKGYYDNREKTIVLSERLDDAQCIKTLFHEMAHSLIHDRDHLKGMNIVKDTRTREIEAESIAYFLCSHFGIDASEYTFPYIASWSENSDMSVLRDSMNTVKETALDMIERIEERLALDRKKELVTDVSRDLSKLYKEAGYDEERDINDLREDIRLSLEKGSISSHEDRLREIYKDESLDEKLRNRAVNTAGKLGMMTDMDNAGIRYKKIGDGYQL